MWATCHTEACENSGIPLDVGSLTETDPDGNVQKLDVYCGVCQQQITDLSAKQPPMPPDPDEETEDHPDPPVVDPDEPDLPPDDWD